jgi:hypothetical protein
MIGQPFLKRTPSMQNRGFFATAALAFALSLMFGAAGCSGDDTPGGTAAPTCPEPQTLCDDACYNLQSSPQACGACGTTCADGEVCSEGVCTLVCAAGLVECGGACIDPLTDRGFCGASQNCEGPAAGSVCDDTEVCSGGTCQTNCTGGTLLCDGRCADPDYDPDYCGATADCAGENAGEVCATNEVCDQGACRSECGPDNLVCGSSCIDPMTNPNFCGASDDCTDGNAGEVCAAGSACVDGTCQPNCPEGQIICNGQCVDPMTNPNFCGASGTCTDADAGRACDGNQACLGGTCFEAGVSFVSPFNRRGDSSMPRDVVYTFDQLIPGVTIHYTVDGTDPVPGMGSTTTTTDLFQVGPLADASEVRWVVEVDGRLSEVQSLRAVVEPTNQRGAIIENLQIDGQGPVATVEPGATVNITANIQYWKQNSQGFCPGCVVQTNVSMAEVGRIRCFEDPLTRGYPGLTDTINSTITAPSEPGDYPMAVTNPLTFGCGDISTGYTGGAVVGVLQVRPPVRTAGGN